MNFRKLEVYRPAIQFLPVAAEIGQGLPKGHASLADQLRRASMSIALNIAEGSGKTSQPDARRYYAIARGSAMECGAIVDACQALELMDSAQAGRADEMLLPIVRMLSKMARG